MAGADPDGRQQGTGLSVSRGVWKGLALALPVAVAFWSLGFFTTRLVLAWLRS
jgi:hypothetical protein